MSASAGLLLGEVKSRLQDNSSLDARWLVGLALGRDEAVFSHQSVTITPPERARLTQLIDQRNSGRPISRMRGKREFYTQAFYLNAHTLDPRPDSECLIDEALAYVNAFSADGRGVSCLDLGTGTGCLLLSFLHALPQATGLGVDLAPLALAQARANAARIGLSNRARFAVSNWTSAVNGQFDLVLANPPYIAKNDNRLSRDVAGHDPALALFAGHDGLMAYAHIFPQISGVLKAEGRLFLEIGIGQTKPVSSLAEQAGLHLLSVRKDMSGRDRCLVFCKK